jgi:hypothetical protein
MDHMPRLQAVAARDHGVAGVAAADFFAFRTQFGPGGAKDRAAHTAAGCQRCIGRIDDGIDVERGEVADQEIDVSLTGFDGEKRGV